ncbi:hypothetical protein G6M89_04840 [Natronolimnobius sp. AArcel1]|uniref:hypothetical protein n=1 Tax=Natronolimnobius sp. AArcel1 TaxID=1679093 RepID=UPI0013EE0E9F|nr:hypothetical protein [Natronolimnobius sp. AArcel1]NGM68342.1 hypothetical protein [Natronolimnobius sp. AArcel1]
MRRRKALKGLASAGTAGIMFPTITGASSANQELEDSIEIERIEPDSNELETHTTGTNQSEAYFKAEYNEETFIVKAENTAGGDVSESGKNFYETSK